MNFVRNFKMAMNALNCVVINLTLYYLMMEIDRMGGPKHLFILVRVLFMISIIMQLLVALGVLKVTEK